MGLVPYGNTAQAFEKAIALGAPMLEFDVRRLGDGTLVTYHDSHLGAAPLTALDWRNFHAATRHLGFEALTLDETLALCRGRIRVDVELKEPGYEAAVVRAIRAQLKPDDAIAKSFHEASVRALRAFAPHIQVGLLLGDAVSGPGDLARALLPEAAVRRTDPQFLCPGTRYLRLGMLARLRRIGRPIYVWTVNDPAEMRALVAAGVTGLVTDRPDLALETFA
jgi:glycerophosphoryl diester phosphodiesterase